MARRSSPLQCVRAPFPWQHFDDAAHRFGNLASLVRRAIGKSNLRCALRREARHHRARRASRAEDHDRTAVGTPIWIGVAQALDETVSVVVETGERSVLLHDDRIHCANPARKIVDAVEQGKDRLLVRCGDVAAPKAERRNAAHRGFEFFGRHGKQHVAAGNAVVAEPMVVNDRRARMRHRPPQKARNSEGVPVGGHSLLPRSVLIAVAPEQVGGSRMVSVANVAPDELAATGALRRTNSVGRRSPSLRWLGRSVRQRGICVNASPTVFSRESGQASARG